MDLTAISLFSGIGGDTIAAQWAGFETICFVEIDKYCQAVLRKHWPDIPIFGDIDEFDAKKYRDITLVYGGDPCQPNSIAGQRRGSEDNRYKWPAMFRVIRESKPSWVVNENPAGRLTMDFYQVLSDLEGEGYGTRSFVIPACAVNAPHRRDRVYIVAYSGCFGNNGRGIKCPRPEETGSCNRTTRPDKNITSDTIGKQNDTANERRFHAQSSGKNSNATYPDNQWEQQSKGTISKIGGWPDNGDKQDVADSEHKRCTAGEEKGLGEISGWRPHDSCQIEKFGYDVTNTDAEGLQAIGTEPTDGIETYHSWNENPLEVAAYLCRVDDGLPSRVERLKALGNAQVPQQIYQIFKGIADIERMKANKELDI